MFYLRNKSFVFEFTIRFIEDLLRKQCLHYSIWGDLCQILFLELGKNCLFFSCFVFLRSLKPIAWFSWKYVVEPFSKQCVKSVHNRSFSSPYFSVFSPNGGKFRPEKPQIGRILCSEGCSQVFYRVAILKRYTKTQESTHGGVGS